MPIKKTKVHLKNYLVNSYVDSIKRVCVEEALDLTTRKISTIVEPVKKPNKTNHVFFDATNELWRAQVVPSNYVFLRGF